MRIEGILGDAHGVDDAAGAVVQLAAMVGVGVGENDLYATRRHAGASARTLTPVVVPATHHLDGQSVHVVVVVGCGLTAIERAVALLVVGVAPLVPVLAQSLVATVLHRPHGVLLRLVNIQHLAAIFSLIDVEHLATADGTSTVGVVGIADGLHLDHVFPRDTFVAALVEQYGGVVAVVDDGIAHQLCALRPAWPLHVLLGITGRHGLDESHAVARLDILLPRRDVHPAYQVGSRLHHQTVGVVAEPGRDGDSYARPLVRGTLGIAVYHQHAVVEPYLALAEAGLAETRAGDNLII